MRMLQINQKTKDIIRMKRTKQGKNYIWIDLLQIKGQSSGQIENAEEINEDRHTQSEQTSVADGGGRRRMKTDKKIR